MGFLVDLCPRIPGIWVGWDLKDRPGPGMDISHHPRVSNLALDDQPRSFLPQRHSQFSPWVSKLEFLTPGKDFHPFLFLFFQDFSFLLTPQTQFQRFGLGGTFGIIHSKGWDLLLSQLDPTWPWMINLIPSFPDIIPKPHPCLQAGIPPSWEGFPPFSLPFFSPRFFPLLIPKQNSRDNSNDLGWEGL